MRNNLFIYQTEIGKIGIVENGTAITNVFYYNETALPDLCLRETALLRAAGGQLNEYLAGRRTTFDLPLAPGGTEFQQKAWKALQHIPYGATRSYGEIAKCIGQPTAARAVGMANSRNPIMIFIPCHRVVGASGKLAGYAGGLPVKQYLLTLEHG